MSHLIIFQQYTATMPSSDEDNVPRWSRFLGNRDVSTLKRVERPSSLIEDRQSDSEHRSLDTPSIDTVIHIDTGQEQLPVRQDQPKHQLRRKKGRIFSKGGVLGALRKFSGNRSPSSSSDPEDAPSRPHIVPPLHDSSHPERSSIRRKYDVGHGYAAVGKSSKAIGSAFRRDLTLIDPRYALTAQEKLLEIMELIKVRTASPWVTLQRLAELDDTFDGQERQGLLEIARAAANVASKEYSGVRRTRPKKLVARALERNAVVPLSEVNNYREYVGRLRLQAEEMQDSVWGLAVFQEASHGVEHVRRCFNEMSDVMKRGDTEADMIEIRWLVERKCMFWAAVDILTADDTQLDKHESMHD